MLDERGRPSCTRDGDDEMRCMLRRSRCLPLSLAGGVGRLHDGARVAGGRRFHRRGRAGVGQVIHGGGAAYRPGGRTGV